MFKTNDAGLAGRSAVVVILSCRLLSWIALSIHQ